MANALILSPLPIVSVAASNTSRGPAMNMANDFAGVVWRSAVAPDASIIIDLGRDVAFDTVMLFGVDGDQIDSAQVIVFVATAAQGPAFNGVGTGSGTGTGNYWRAPAVPLLTGGQRGSSGRGVTMVMWGAGPPAANRYVNVYVGALGAGGAVQIARVVIGKRFVPERNFRFGAGFGVRDLGKVDFSRFGVPLRTRGAKLRTTSLTFSSLKRDEVETSTRPLLERHGNTEFLALVTDPAIVPDLPNRCYFGPIVGDNPGHVWRNAAGWETTLNLVSAF